MGGSDSRHIRVRPRRHPFLVLLGKPAHGDAAFEGAIISVMAWRIIGPYSQGLLSLSSLLSHSWQTSSGAFTINVLHQLSSSWHRSHAASLDSYAPPFFLVEPPVE